MSAAVETQEWIDYVAIFGADLIEEIANLTGEARGLARLVADLLQRGRAADDAWTAAISNHPDEDLLRGDALFARLFADSGLERLTELCGSMAGQDAAGSFGEPFKAVIQEVSVK